MSEVLATVYYHHMAWGWGVLWMLGLLLVVALAAAVVLGALRERGGAGPATIAPSARELLDRRLASGEITVEEYERLRAAMATGPSSRTPAGPVAPG